MPSGARGACRRRDGTDDLPGGRRGQLCGRGHARRSSEEPARLVGSSRSQPPAGSTVGDGADAHVDLLRARVPRPLRQPVARAAVARHTCRTEPRRRKAARSPHPCPPGRQGQRASPARRTPSTTAHPPSSSSNVFHPSAWTPPDSPGFDAAPPGRSHTSGYQRRAGLPALREQDPTRRRRSAPATTMPRGRAGSRPHARPRPPGSAAKLPLSAARSARTPARSTAGRRGTAPPSGSR